MCGAAFCGRLLRGVIRATVMVGHCAGNLSTVFLINKMSLFPYQWVFGDVFFFPHPFYHLYCARPICDALTLFLLGVSSSGTSCHAYPCSAVSRVLDWQLMDSFPWGRKVGTKRVVFAGMMVRWIGCSLYS